MPEMLLDRYKKKSFLYRIATGDEKWIYYDNPNAKNHMFNLAIQFNQRYRKKPR